MNQVAVIGSNGAIGQALVRQLAAQPDTDTVYAFSRSGDAIEAENIISLGMDYSDEVSIAAAAATINHELDLVLVTTGVLHDAGVVPEKSMRELSAEKFRHLFAVNTIVPALLAKYFLPKLSKSQRSVFAALSARVGSISDNQLGGWYAYRASKAALNMVIKNLAIEVGRFHKQAIIVGLHPGTVDSNLSQPFQSRVPAHKLFTPDYAAEQLLAVLANLTSADSGNCFAWDGKLIEP